MDAFDGELSDVEESQATQLLLDIVPGKSPSPGLPSKGSSKPTAVQPAGADISVDSHNSSRISTSIPTYHFHGLATTQTETDLTMEDHNGGSQKENIQAPVGAAEIQQVEGGSRAVQGQATPSISKSGHNKASHSVSHSKSRTPNARPIALSSLQSPSNSMKQSLKSSMRQKPSNSVASSSRKSTKSPIRAEDSFAHDPFAHPRDVFIATNEQFRVPINRVGASSMARNVSSSSSGLGYTMPRRGGPIVAELQGNVLVESTPTNSASSQDHSAEQLHPNEEATQLVDDYDSDSDPPSSLGASLFVPGPPVPAEPEKQSENTSEWVATQAATQVVDEVATQLDEPTTVAGVSHYATAHTTIGPSVQSAQPNNVGPRSLLGLVPPGNRYRYNNYRGPQVQQQPPQPPAVPSTTTSAGPALPYYNLLDPTQRNNLSQANWEETQPNYVPPPAPSSPVPPPADVSGSRVQDVGSDDAMDIVPDSEAQRLGPQKPASDVEMRSDEEESPAHAPKNKKPESKGSNVVVPSSESEEESDTNSDERPTKRRAIEREQESEEDDIPLASNAKRTKNVAKTTNKGKAKSIATEEGVKPPSNSKPAQTGRTARKKPEPVPAVTTRGMQKKANIANRSWETGVVPSSIPEEEVTPAPAAGKRKAKGQKQAARAPAAKGRKPLEDEEEVEATDEEGGGDGPEGGEVESTPAPSGPSRGNKRKRGGNAKAGQKAVAKREAKRQAAQPKADKGKDHDRMAKLLRSAKRNPNATRVFAHWQPDGYWYPGIVKCYQDPTHWVVKFDDNNEAHLSIEQMRLADLRVDDEVCYGGSKVFFSVTNVDKLAKGLITVRTPQGETELPVKDIRISPTTINVKWKDRMVDPELIQPYLDNVHGQQSPSQGTNVLWKTAVVLTSSVNNASQNKESFMTASQKTGATIVEDLVSFFNMTGEWQEAGKRWVIKKQDVELNRKDICRLFLLADGANQKPKYLMALGLGIPCLSLKWLETCAAENEDVDWPPFLLPQGQYNDSCLTQMVDLNWGTSAYHLANIMDNPAPMKLMKGTSVLCVGHDIFPQPKGKSHPNNEQGFQDGINYCTRIILAMGADSVEAVLNPDFASRGFDDYTYIVTRAPPAENKWPELPRSRLVDWSWVKSCLIANRLLPTPELPQQEHSQEV